MDKFLGGLALGLALGGGGAAAYFLVTPSEPESPTDCGGTCGDGTVCDAGRCIITPDEEPEPEPDKKSKKRRSRSRRGGDGGDAVADGFKPVDDSKVPRFNPTADRTIDLNAGSERLSDSVVDRELRKLDSKFQGCVRTAATHADDLGTGTVTMKFGVGGNGKVTGVNASAPANLAKWGIVPCVRKSVHQHRFPTFDGPVMRVESSFRVD